MAVFRVSLAPSRPEPQLAWPPHNIPRAILRLRFDDL